MNRITKARRVQIRRRRFLKLLSAMGLGILALPAIPARRGPAPLSLREADYYRPRDQVDKPPNYRSGSE